MKKIILVLFILFAGTIIFSSKSNAQVVVVRPTPPVAVTAKPTAPFPKAIWIEPEWRWDAPTRAYVYVPGHWIKPRTKYAWVRGALDVSPRRFPMDSRSLEEGGVLSHPSSLTFTIFDAENRL